MRVLCLTIALAFGSCGGEPEPSRPAAATDDPPPTSAAAAGEAPPSEAEAAGTARGDGHTPSVVFVASAEAEGVGLSLANHGTSEVSFRAAVAVEAEGSSGAFAPAEGTAALTLRPDCTHEAERCVALAPGAELLPPHWLGTWGDAQCVCTRCGPVAAGRYRLVVTTCDGQHRVESNAVTLPAR